MAVASHLIPAFVVTALLIPISIFIMRRLRTALVPQPANAPNDLSVASDSQDPTATKLSKVLASALPDAMIFPHDEVAFRKSMNSYWAQQECEVVPACVVQPRDAQQLSIAVKILKREFDEREEGKTDKNRSDKNNPAGLFAFRGGGHSPMPGAASVRGGVLIDLSLLREVTPSEDGASVVIGAGAKWMDVSKVLDERGLAVVGGRNSAVGVGGLALGGGLSFFSPRFGLVCSNITSYELVLASGAITTASESSNPDLWRALKGGSSNFGIVTSFTARSFPCGMIWSGFLYLPSFQATKTLAAFHECVKRAGASFDNNTTTASDDHAAGPIACFSYVQQLGIQAISVNLVHTSPQPNEKKWPLYWRESPFKPLFRFWSTCKIRTLTSATDEMNSLNPPGRRQVFATTTIKNDLATITQVHTAYQDAIASLRPVNVKGLVWTLVLQPIVPDWVKKGDANPMGLHDCTENLVMVSFTVNWNEAQHDDFVKTTTRRTIEQMESIASANKTGHRWRYLNYCAEWQKPFEGYGEENWRFLQDVSRKYDPDGLFQKGCLGGFKLGIAESEA
ncbi:Bifunctional solanapyrone synthase [Lachnellula occidentalis]|uniref:Bifunctional solanapyrone synthase n=1 Tax=Lachnellula occidentalis TaxID=215460 RepID=A0A8H8RFS3_9HELO|nr:Bifunctional solanapyrone synthase [Lachnellula occidentalis]